ncbi:hypothetical protein ABPG74_020607 [Tetrahymena malaccensis]
MTQQQYEKFEDEIIESNCKIINSKDQKCKKALKNSENDESLRQDVSVEIYSNEDQRKQLAEEQQQKLQQEKEEERQKRISKIVSFVFGVLPIIVMVGIFILFSLDDGIKNRVIDMFTNIKQLNFEISFYLIIYGALLIFLSFPYLIFEMSLGFTFSFPIAVFFAVFAKVIGEIVCFSLSRYVFKDLCLQFLRMNEYFIVLERAVKKYPWLVSNLLRGSILVPLFVVNFGSGIIDITFIQYIIPALLWGTLYSIFAVLCGSQLLNIKDVLANAAFPQNKTLFFFELSMVIISLVIMIAIIWKSGQMYEDIQKEIKEQMIMEKQLQSTKAMESITNINIKVNKQSSSIASSLVECADEENSKQSRIEKQKQKTFDAFQIDNKKQDSNNIKNF